MKTPLCPQCKSAHLVSDPITKVMICPNCGYKTGADIDEKGRIRNKDVEKENLRMGKKFELGTFI
jgi:uncharacterized Zn ribbon protein